MVLIVGIATTAAGAIVLFNRIQRGDFGDPNAVIRVIRQTTGVVLAIGRFISTALDALMLIRPAASAAGQGGLRPVIGAPAGD